MKTAVLGTGMVGRTLAAKLVELGHDVEMGTRDPAATAARAVTEGGKSMPFSEWLARRPAIRLGPLVQAARHGQILWNASSGAGSLDMLAAAGADKLDERVLVDVANPLDFSKGMPPTLLVKDTDSLAERIQRAYPKLKVVKALNTMNAAIMVNPASVAGGAHAVFLCGNDAGAKAVVRKLLESFGWRDILDLGDITGARGMEMVLPLWLRLYSVIGKPTFNFAVAR